MLQAILDHYNYWIAIVLMMVGFYTVVARGNLIKKLVGLNIFQASNWIEKCLGRTVTKPLVDITLEITKSSLIATVVVRISRNPQTCSTFDECFTS